jgi:beta-catenin-like protein 1
MKENEIQEILNEAQEIKEIDTNSLKKLLMKFEKTIQENQTKRSKYPTDPIKYIDSEVDLVQELKELTRIPPNLYTALIQYDGHLNILSLLEHPNTDISISTIDLLVEILDDEELLEELVKNNLIGLLVDNLSRMDLNRLDDKQGIFSTFELLENIIQIDPNLSFTIFSKINNYCLDLIKKPDFDSIKQYCTELLAIIMTNSQESVIKLGSSNEFEIILQELAKYMRKDPSDGDELEMVENLFDITSQIVSQKECRSNFMKLQGIHLLILMQKQKRYCRKGAIKLSSHLLTNSNTEICNSFIELGGLSKLFPILMKNSLKELDEYLVSIIAFLFIYSDYKDRLRMKFIENGFEKLNKILLILYQSKNIKNSDYLDRLDNGLYTVQMCCIIIAYLYKELQIIPDLLLEMDYSIVKVKSVLSGKILLILNTMNTLKLIKWI